MVRNILHTLRDISTEAWAPLQPTGTSLSSPCRINLRLCLKCLNKVRTRARSGVPPPDGITAAAVARHPDQDLFRRRPLIPSGLLNSSDAPTYGNTLVGTTYGKIQARRTALGSALLSLERSGRLRSAAVASSQPSPPELTQEGVPYFGNHNRVKHGARRGWAVGLWSKNRDEWMIVDLACQAYGLCSVSLYETLGPDVAEYM